MDIKNYLIHSYLYYECDESIIPDSEFDQLCRRLLMNWSTQQSAYKKYISKHDLEAGTGFTLFYNHQTGKRDYPSEIVVEAQTRLAEWQAKKCEEYRTVSDNPDELYEDLKDAKGWFLAGLFVDYNYFLKENPKKRKMALAVIERIFKERKDGQEGEAA